MSNYKQFPEMLAMLIFLPVGIFMGHMMNYIQTTLYASSAYMDVKYWPFIVGAVVALLTSSAHFGIKQNYKQYKYEHMYFQMVGLAILFITGILLMIGELQAVAFFGCIGHGIIYVSALSYINIRTGKSKHRYLKLSIPHFVYLIGVSIGATIVWTDNEIPLYISPDTINWWNYNYYGETTGVLINITSCILFGGFLINEILQHGNGSYNYKQSLDNDINRENTNKQILKNKYFHITPQHLNLPANVQLPDVPLKTEPSGMKEFGFILYALASKVLTLMFFYYPFLFLQNSATSLSGDTNIFLVYWLGTAGFAISLVLMALVSYKINYLLSIIVKITFMVVLIIFFSYEIIFWYDLKILFWFVYVGLGFGFSHSDINILSYTNLKTNEIILALGYLIEFVIVGVLQYETLVNPSNIFNTSPDSNFMLPHALTFILILAGIGMGCIFVIPNGRHRSLLEIKNILNKCTNINQLVNTGNYDGQQNSQLYWQQQAYLQQNYPQIAHIPPQFPPMPYNPNNSAYQPPYSQNMFHYGQPNYQQPSQQYLQHPQPQYQQTPYINTTYPSQVNSLPPQQLNNTDVPSLNYQNLPLNVAPLTDNSFSPPPQYDQNIAHSIVPPTKMN